MSPEDVLADLDQAAQDFAEEIAAQMASTTGIPKAPTIEVTESKLEPEVFNFNLDPRTEAQALSTGGGPTPPPACDPVTIEVAGLAIPACFVEIFCTIGAGSAAYTDLSVNGTKLLDVQDVTARCGDGSTPPGCYTFGFNVDYHYKAYVTADCSGSPFVDADGDIVWQVAKIGATWYIMATDFPNSTGTLGVFFYADTTDISSPIPNQLTSFSAACGDTALPSSAFMDNWFGDCTPGSGDFMWTVLGKNGTVTIT